ncbi:MAG: hypothetical protein GY927_06620 [bacterium]|nr:hypothetical protein [bacterium]
MSKMAGNRNIFWRIKSKIVRIYHKPSSLNHELQFAKRALKETFLFEPALNLVGSNWNTHPDLSVAVLWGTDNWQRENIAATLPEYRTVFIGHVGQLNQIANELKELRDENSMVFISWGPDLPLAQKKYAKQNNIPIHYMEDGFLLSCGFGDPHSRLHSMILDKSGLYFDDQKSSDLENILNKIKFDNKPEMLQQAKAGLGIMKAARLSKYYSLADLDKKTELEKTKEYSVLIIGQKETHHLFKSRNVRNSALIHRVAAEFPDAQLFYQPHPETRLKLKKNHLGAKDTQAYTILDKDIPFYDLISQVDRVCTHNSLKGLEAHIMGQDVTVFGKPFYEGWGVTDDRQKRSRQKAKLGLEELFAGAYLLYPRYLHPTSDVLCSFFDVASYFIVERVKHDDILDIDNSKLDFVVLRENAAHLASPAQLLLYLNTTKYLGEANTDKVMEIAKAKFRLADFPQFSHLLIHTSNYDALQHYCNYAVAQFNERWDDIKHDRSLLANFFLALGTAQKNSNGRILDAVDDHSAELVELMALDPSYQLLAVNYIRVLSNNLIYDPIAKFLDALEKTDNPPDNFFPKLCSVLLARPTRSERDHAYRHMLLYRSAEQYKIFLSHKYHSRHDVFLNICLYHMAIDNQDGVIQAYDMLMSLFDKEGFSFDNPELNQWGSLSIRQPQIISVYHYLLKKGRYEYVKNMLETQFYVDEKLRGTHQKAVMDDLWLSYHSTRSDHESYIRKLNSSSPRTQNKPKTIIAYSRALKAMGEFELARNILEGFRPSIRSHDKWVAVATEIQKISFSIRTGQILASYPQPKIPKGVIFLASQTCYNTMAMMVPSLLSLKKKGYAVINLMQGMLPLDPTGIDYIDQFAASIPTTFYSHDLHNSWKIDWEKRHVVSCGINFYQGFYERLSTAHRLYHVDINTDAIQRDFMVQLKRSDTCLNISNKIFNTLVRRNINVAFVTGNSHVTPFSAFRDFARAKDDPRLSFINCNVAYESYFSNLGSKFAQTMCVTDMTLDRDRRAPFMALKKDFDAWYEKNQDNSKFKELAESMIKVNRNSSTSNETEQQLIKYLSEQKQAGKKIICCFGKVPVDLNVPYDGGPAHQDMADWITHTAEVCGQSDNIIMLVKPHPHELRPEIALDLIDSFSDLIDTEIKPNVKVLGHRDINVHALAPYLDLAVLWNGSSSLELTALGIPVLMCSHFGRHDYPVELLYPSSREQYREFLHAGSYRIPPEELRSKAAFLISYMGTDEISIHNDYALRQLTNDKVGVPRWQEDRITELLANGDPKMDLIAERVVEKFKCSG